LRGKDLASKKKKKNCTEKKKKTKLFGQKIDVGENKDFPNLGKKAVIFQACEERPVNGVVPPPRETQKAENSAKNEKIWEKKNRHRGKRWFVIIRGVLVGRRKVGRRRMGEKNKNLGAENCRAYRDGENTSS